MISKRTIWILGGLVVIIAGLLLIRGCSKRENSAFEPYASNAPKGAIAAVVNRPDDALAATAVDKFEVDNTDNRMLVVPRYLGSTVSIEPVRLEGENLVALPAKYVAPDIPNNWSLLLKALRPEGAPMWRITVSSPGGTISYIISYNGKDGNPPIEYIAPKQ